MDELIHLLKQLAVLGLIHFYHQIQDFGEDRRNFRVLHTDQILNGLLSDCGRFYAHNRGFVPLGTALTALRLVCRKTCFRLLSLWLRT